MAGRGIMKPLTAEVTAFFDSFVAAFGTFDGEVVSRLFSHPYLAVDQHGNQRVFNGAKAIASYFQHHLDNYKSIGSASCSYEALEIIPVGALSALVTVTWRLQGADGHELSTWRESYCVLQKEGGKLFACASIDHAE